MPKIQIRVENKLLPSDKVKNATVSFAGSTVSGTTNNSGIVNLDATSLADGTHTLSIVPAHTTTAPVGPATGTTGSPTRIFRSLDVTVTLKSGLLQTATVVGAAANGSVRLDRNTRLTVKLQPVWMRSSRHRSRGGAAIDLIIVHHTGGPKIGPALNWFLHPKGASAGYIIDTDGQIVKLVLDARASFQAGTSHWKGVNDVNDNSIGIEIVHSAGSYQAAQYISLIALLKRLVAAHKIDGGSIIGHSDIATNSTRVLGRKSGDPGTQFEWSRLEAKNLSLGVRQIAGPPPPSLYSDFFNKFPGNSFRRGDKDSTHKFGGSSRPTITGTPVHDLQTDLQRIGYSVGTPDGDYGQKTDAAVKMLQEHFHGKGLVRTGRVDLATAQLMWALY